MHPFLPSGYYYDLDDSYDESDEEEVRAHLRCVAEQPPLKLDTSSEVTRPSSTLACSGLARLLVPTLGLRRGFPTPQAIVSAPVWPSTKSDCRPQDPWGSKSILRTVASYSFVFFSNLEARVFATFWLDHPTAEGGAGSTEAPEAEADAEREKPITTRDSKQAADTFPQAGSVHPLQP